MERSRDKKTEPRPKFHIATLIEVMGDSLWRGGRYDGDGVESVVDEVELEGRTDTVCKIIKVYLIFVIQDISVIIPEQCMNN